jgi:hypothetical protein
MTVAVFQHPEKEVIRRRSSVGRPTAHVREVGPASSFIQRYKPASALPRLMALLFEKKTGKFGISLQIIKTQPFFYSESSDQRMRFNRKGLVTNINGNVFKYQIN